MSREPIPLNLAIGEAINLAADTGDYAGLADFADQCKEAVRDAYFGEPYNRDVARTWQRLELISDVAHVLAHGNAADADY
jgi:hypothetical protein